MFDDASAGATAPSGSGSTACASMDGGVPPPQAQRRDVPGGDLERHASAGAA